MRYNFKNNKGNVLVLLCAGFTTLIGFSGICVDGSMLTYQKSKLMAATKLAAVSSSAHYTVDNGNITINASESDAQYILTKNYNGSTTSNDKGKSFEIDGNKVTVRSKANVNFAFVKIFGINSTNIYESYTATRS